MDAGAETSSSFLQTFVIALLQNPESQRKAQEEIDRVIGGDRMPILDDFERLPYVKALVREVSRRSCMIVHTSLLRPTESFLCLSNRFSVSGPFSPSVFPTLCLRIFDIKIIISPKILSCS